MENPDPVKWHYLDETSTAVGPFERQDLHRLCVAGVITEDTLVSNTSNAEWIPYRISPAYRPDNPRFVPPPLPVATSPALQLIPVVCPNCGGNLRVPDRQLTTHCTYCGTDVAIHRNAPSDARLQNLPELAIAAEAAGNHLEAYRYFSGILEADPANAEAWLGKGIAAGWQSTLANARVQETAACFHKAFDLGLDAKQVARLTGEAARISKSFFDLALRHRARFRMNLRRYSTGTVDRLLDGLSDKSHNARLDAEFIQHGTSALTLVQTVWAIQPTSELARNGLEISDSLALTRERTVEQALLLPQSAKEPLLQEAKRYRELSKTFHAWGQANVPGWQTPTRACFIATAAAGDPYHPAVVSLRRFRDLHLRKTRIGLMLISTYYVVGPYAASVIGASDLLRALAYACLVRPAWKLSELADRP